MGNNCCQKPGDEPVLKTLESNDKDDRYNNDKYPHDSDSGFKNIKNKDKNHIKPFSNGNIIEEEE